MNKWFSKILQQLGLFKKSNAMIFVRDGEPSVRPVDDILNLRGSLKTTKKPLTNTQLHDHFVSGYESGSSPQSRE